MIGRFVIPLLSISTLAFSQLAPARRITQIVSAASGKTGIAPNSIASIYGVGLANGTEAAAGTPLPTQLAGVTVLVGDGVHSRNAELLYASPTQINLVVPPGILPGFDTVTVSGPSITYATSTIPVVAVAPGIFSANGTGAGVAAAIGIRTVIPTHLQGTVNVFTCDPNSTTCRAIPLDVGVDAPVTVEFFGTGIRNGSKVTATIGGQPVPVDFAGPQPQFSGLDQVNLPLILSLRGAGTVDVIVTVDGQASNPVQVAIQ